MKHIKKLVATVCLLSGVSYGAHSAELSLAYFMGPKHPMNKGVFTPFGEKLNEVSGGALTVKQFAGGALNKSPPKQYSILLDGVADVVFALPGYTADVFPKTNALSLPGVCDTALACTESLQRARAEIEPEYNAKVLALWANAPAVLVTKDKPVRTLEDLKGMKIRVTSKADAAFVEALGASAVAQPVSVINQNLANGVIDAVMIDPSGIRSFKLNEVAKYVTTWFPNSGSPFALLMNKEVYDEMSDEEKAWIDEASAAELSLNAGKAYDAAGAGGLKVAAESGLEMIELPAAEKEKIEALVNEAMVSIRETAAGDSTIGAMIEIMQGK